MITIFRNFDFSSSIAVAVIGCLAASGVYAETRVRPEAPAVPPPPTSEVGLSAPGLSLITLNDLPEALQDRARRVSNEYRDNGFLKVDDAEIERYSIANLSRGFVADTSSIQSKLSKTIDRGSKRNTAHSLTVGDSFAAAEFGSTKLEGVLRPAARSDGTVFAITRVFSAQDKSSVVFSETDISSNGFGVKVPVEAINANVNGYPAILNVVKGESGNFVATISWFTDTTHFTLHKYGMKSANVEGIKKKLLLLAERID